MTLDATRQSFADHLKKLVLASMVPNVSSRMGLWSCALCRVILNTKLSFAELFTLVGFVHTDLDVILYTMKMMVL
jgi:hypothetical protein